MMSAVQHDYDRDAGATPVSYWCETRRPLVCLVFVAPMLLVYEGGIVVFGMDAMRNGVDVYLRQFLDILGFGQYFLLPILAGSILLAWHHTTGQSWRVRSGVFAGMWCESLALGMCLVLFARLQGVIFNSAAVGLTWATDVGQGNEFVGRLIGYFGAGIYEELFFRLMLLPATAGLFCYCGASRSAALLAAVIITSFVFSAAHYQFFTFNDGADAFQWFSFVFRFLAGTFFALVFLYRGFGVSAAVHALYDILVHVL